VLLYSLMTVSKLSYLIISIFILTIFTNKYVSYAESVISPASVEVAVEIDCGKDTALFTKYTPIVQISLLSDRNDILSQIENLREQSKVELEPLVKQYMLTAEKLTQLTAKTDADTTQTIQQSKKRLSSAFKAIEKEINAVLIHYQAIIDSRIQQNTLETFMLSCSDVSCHFQNVAPGKYRIYGVMTFSTTTLRWFEPVIVKSGVQNSFCKGGDRPTVYLTRDNIMNPYWTELNWWSFMNLDFSKHH
jgi:hypothetical protein